MIEDSSSSSDEGRLSHPYENTPTRAAAKNGQTELQIVARKISRYHGYYINDSGHIVPVPAGYKLHESGQLIASRDAPATDINAINLEPRYKLGGTEKSAIRDLIWFHGVGQWMEKRVKFRSLRKPNMRTRDHHRRFKLLPSFRLVTSHMVRALAEAEMYLRFDPSEEYVCKKYMESSGPLLGLEYPPGDERQVASIRHYCHFMKEQGDGFELTKETYFTPRNQWHFDKLFTIPAENPPLPRTTAKKEKLLAKLRAAWNYYDETIFGYHVHEMQDPGFPKLVQEKEARVLRVPNERKMELGDYYDLPLLQTLAALARPLRELNPDSTQTDLEMIIEKYIDIGMRHFQIELSDLPPLDESFYISEDEVVIEDDDVSTPDTDDTEVQKMIGILKTNPDMHTQLLQKPDQPINFTVDDDSDAASREPKSKSLSLGLDASKTSHSYSRVSNVDNDKVQKQDAASAVDHAAYLSKNPKKYPPGLVPLKSKAHIAEESKFDRELAWLREEHEQAKAEAQASKLLHEEMGERIREIQKALEEASNDDDETYLSDYLDFMTDDMIQVQEELSSNEYLESSIWCYAREFEYLAASLQDLFSRHRFLRLTAINVRNTMQVLTSADKKSEAQRKLDALVEKIGQVATSISEATTQHREMSKGLEVEKKRLKRPIKSSECRPDFETWLEQLEQGRAELQKIASRLGLEIKEFPILGSDETLDGTKARFQPLPEKSQTDTFRRMNPQQRQLQLERAARFKHQQEKEAKYFRELSTERKRELEDAAESIRAAEDPSQKLGEVANRFWTDFLIQGGQGDPEWSWRIRTELQSLDLVARDAVRAKTASRLDYPFSKRQMSINANSTLIEVDEAIAKVPELQKLSKEQENRQRYEVFKERRKFLEKPSQKAMETQKLKSSVKPFSMAAFMAAKQKAAAELEQQEKAKVKEALQRQMDAQLNVPEPQQTRSFRYVAPPDTSFKNTMRSQSLAQSTEMKEPAAQTDMQPVLRERQADLIAPRERKKMERRNRKAQRRPDTSYYAGASKTMFGESLHLQHLGNQELHRVLGGENPNNDKHDPVLIASASKSTPEYDFRSLFNLPKEEITFGKQSRPKHKPKSRSNTHQKTPSQTTRSVSNPSNTNPSPLNYTTPTRPTQSTPKNRTKQPAQGTSQPTKPRQKSPFSRTT